MASPYPTPYFYNRRFIDKQYGIEREDDSSFMIGDFTLTVEVTSDISREEHFKGTCGLCELLTRKNENTAVIKQTI